MLVLTLPIPTTTTERSISVMNIVKNRLYNNMENDFLINFLIIYIEKETVIKLSTNIIAYDFRDLKKHRVPF